MKNRFHDCQTLKELQQRLREDAGRRDRWPTRLILVSGLAYWRQVLEILRNEVDQTICLSDYCQAANTLPFIPQDLASLLKASPEGRTLILPVSELLRLHEDLGGALLRSLTTWEYPSRFRVYVPLWQAENLIMKQLRCVPRWQDGELPPAWSLSGPIDELLVYLTLHTINKLPGFEVSKDLKTYLQKWEMGGPQSHKLIVTTAFAQVAQPSVGRVEVRVCRSGYDLVREFLIDIGGIEEAWGTPEHWDWLAQEISPGESFSQMAARVLNVHHYDFEAMLDKWPVWPSEKKWLFWLWSRLVLPGRYARLVLQRSRAWEDFPDECWLSVFQGEIILERESLEERKAILEKSGEVKPPPAFWDQWRDLKDPEQQLRVLTGLSHREREEAVKLTQRLLREGRPLHIIRELLDLAYPALAWYLSLPPGVDERLLKYLKEYYRARLLDQGTPELYSLAEELAATDYLWQFEARHRVLEAKRPGVKEEIWLDGCGVEWLGFIEAFCRRRQIPLEINIVRANLPSITEMNRGWPDTTSPVRGLDELAHSYDYQFPQSFVKELEWFKAQLDRIIEKLTEVPALILTADHGLSRYLFHKDRTIIPPAGAEVDKWGRCARIKEVTPEISSNSMWQVEGNHVSIKGYGRFQGGSGSPGEVHGGATLEEVLVPVLVLRRLEAAEVVNYRLELRDTLIRFDAKRTGTLSEVRCEPDPGELHMRTWDQRLINGQRLGKGRYTFTLTDLHPGEFPVRFEVQGQSIKEIKIKVTSAGLQEEDMGI